MIDERAQVDWVMLCEYAEAVNGKLYIMGGGGNQITIPSYAQPIQINVAASIAIPWNRANIRFPLTVAVIDSDGNDVMPPYKHNIVAGRGADMVYGQTIPYHMTASIFAMLPAKGTYSVVTEVTDDGVQSSKRATFYARAQGEEL